MKITEIIDQAMPKDVEEIKGLNLGPLYRNRKMMFGYDIVISNRFLDVGEIDFSLFNANQDTIRHRWLLDTLGLKRLTLQIDQTDCLARQRCVLLPALFDAQQQKLTFMGFGRLAPKTLVVLRNYFQWFDFKADSALDATADHTNVDPRGRMRPGARDGRYTRSAMRLPESQICNNVLLQFRRFCQGVRTRYPLSRNLPIFRVFQSIILSQELILVNPWKLTRAVSQNLDDSGQDQICKIVSNDPELKDACARNYFLLPQEFLEQFEQYHQAVFDRLFCMVLLMMWQPSRRQFFVTILETSRNSPERSLRHLINDAWRLMAQDNWQTFFFFWPAFPKSEAAFYDRISQDFERVNNTVTLRQAQIQGSQYLLCPLRYLPLMYGTQFPSTQLVWNGLGHFRAKQTDKFASKLGIHLVPQIPLVISFGPETDVE